MEQTIAMTSVRGARPRARRSRLRRLLLVVSIAAVAVTIVIALPEIRAAGAAIREADPALLVLAMVLVVGAVATLPEVYRASLRAVGGRIDYPRALQVSMGAFTLSRVLPGGGAAGGIFAARKLILFGQRAPVAAAAVSLMGVLAMTTLSFIVAAAAGLSAIRGDVDGPYLGLIAAVLAVLVILAVGAVSALRSDRVRNALVQWVRRVAGQTTAKAVRRSVDELAVRPLGVRQLAPIVGWSAVNWLLEIGALWLIFQAFQYAMLMALLILGFGVANLLTALPHTPGGLGVVEAGMAATYVGFGTPAPIAISAVLAYRVGAYWLPVLAGVPQYLRRGRT